MRLTYLDSKQIKIVQENNVWVPCSLMNTDYKLQYNTDPTDSRRVFKKNKL